jgi:hypothetical protein
LKTSAPLRIFLLIFGATLLCLQVFNYLYIRNLDKEYSTVIRTKIDAMQSFQVIAHETSDIQRGIRNLCFAKSNDSNIWINEIRQSKQKINDRFAVLDHLAANDSEKAAISDLRNKYQAYNLRSDSFIRNFNARRSDDVVMNTGFLKIRDNYENFMAKEDEDTEYFRNQAEKSSDLITRNMHTTSNILLFVGTLPYLLLVCGLIIAILAVLWLGASLKWFSRAE